MSTNIIIQSIVAFMEEENVKNQEVNQVLIAVRQVLSNNIALSNIEQQFDKILSNSEMTGLHLVSMIGLIPIILIEIRKVIQVSKSLKMPQIKYVIYAVLYKYILSHQQSFLYEVSEEGLRTFFNAGWNLVKIIPETITVSKGLVTKCCANSKSIKEPFS